MATTKKYVSLEKLSLYDEKIKKVISDGDIASKAYADSLAKNYDVAGAAATVQGKLDEEVARAKAVEEANAAAAKKAQDEVDALELVVQEIQENAYDDTALRAEMATELAKKADKEQVAKDIAAAVKVEEEARIAAVSGVQGAVDALSGTHATDKKALEDAIALKADQTALDEVSGVANAAATKEALQAEIGRATGEEARIEGLVTAETERAAGIESGLRTDVDAIKGDYLKVADKTELSEAIAAEKTRAEKVEEGLQTQINTIMNNPDAEDAINSINEFTQYVTEHGEIAEGFRTDINANKKAIEDHVALAVETYETKEDATAKFDEVKEYVDAKAVQADWNQNDETAPDYIKNRTHYEDGERTVIAEYSLANLYDASMGMRYLDLEDGVYESLPPKTELKLEVDGIAYPSLTTNNQYQYENVTINGYTDVHVTISSYVEGDKIGFYNLYGKDVSNCTIRLVTDNVTIKQLDEKFIPYTIARTSNLVDVAIRAERIEGDVNTLEGKVSANEEAIAVLQTAIGDNGSVDTMIDNAVSAAIETEVERVDGLLDKKVDKVDGKGLSTNDLTNELKAQYDEAYAHSQVAHAPADAQKNVIEVVKVNGSAVTITDKAVDIAVPTDNSQLTNGAGYLVASDIANKADKATTLAGYGIADAYTSVQTDTAIANAMATFVEVSEEEILGLFQTQQA